MNRINALILDDNITIAKRVLGRIFYDNRIYCKNSGIEIFPHYLEIDNNNVNVAAIAVNNYILEKGITDLLLDRGFGTIIDGNGTNSEFLYKDNNYPGYHIEDLLVKLKEISRSTLNNIRGIIVYTYDDYREIKKAGEIIREEIVELLNDIFPAKCKIDVLLSYSDIYKVAEIDLYAGWAGQGIIKLGRKRDFVLYGIFVGELLYHKLIQMINIRNNEIIKSARRKFLYKLMVLYVVVVSISIGVNAISNYLVTMSIMTGTVSLLFGIILLIAVLILKPSVLIDLEV